MFNYSGNYSRFRNFKALGGTGFGDYETHQTLYAGVDPADPKRALIRKLVQVNNNTYCYEEIRVTPGEKSPIVHTQLIRIGDFNLHEELTPEELRIRGSFRPIPNVLGFSLFCKNLAIGGSHFSIVENTLWKQASGTFREMIRDLRDRRDMSSYLKNQW